MIKIGIVLGSTRPGRRGEAIARFILKEAQQHGGAEFSLVDLADYALPVFDEPAPPSRGQYTKDHTKKWAAAISALDAFIFVTPEYNHSTSGALKNALDFLYSEWADKAAGFVSYGGVGGGIRAVEQLRLICSELRLATVRAQVAFLIRADFTDNFTVFQPGPHHAPSIKALFEQVIAWGTALKPLRSA